MAANLEITLSPRQRFAALIDLRIAAITRMTRPHIRRLQRIVGGHHGLDRANRNPLLAGPLPASARTLRQASGFTSHATARAYAQDLESDRRRGTWFDPAAARTLVTEWAEKWIDSLDVETRTEENYRALLRNHILPYWGYTPLGDITTLDLK